MTYNKTINGFPSLFSIEGLSNYFDEVENDMIYTSPDNSLPTDIIEICDKKEIIIGYELNIACAGIKKEFVTIEMKDDKINILIDKQALVTDKTRKYLHKGISHRTRELTYGIHGIDKMNITANIIDGLLIINLPLKEDVKPKQIKIT